MGDRLRAPLARALCALLCAIAVGLPLSDAAASTPPLQSEPAPVSAKGQPLPDVPAAPPRKGFVDDLARVTFDPPASWLQAPGTALNPLSDPPDAVEEIVRFQISLSDASLYAQPVPLTAALLKDAGAVVSIGVAREDSDLIALTVDPRADREDARRQAGFYIEDEERTYEGLHVFTRYYVARATERRLVARAVTTEDDWSALAPVVRASLDSLRADPNGPNAPAAPPPAPVAPPVATAETTAEAPDPSLAYREDILARAQAMLGTPYVWGGNSPGRGMDCSAYVSAAWAVARYTTDSIAWVSTPVAKEDLRPGDAMDLTVGRDPEGYGHIRLFEAWANAARTLVWVYEETPPRAVHRVIVYDDRYQPIRLDGLSGSGVAPLVPAPAPAPESAPRFVPQRPRGWPLRPTPAPHVRVPWLPGGLPPVFAPGARPIVTPMPRPARTPHPAATTRPLRTPVPTARD